jgi:hypothetical protein
VGLPRDGLVRVVSAWRARNSNRLVQMMCGKKSALWPEGEGWESGHKEWAVQDSNL